jgi:peroxiredoxin
MKFLLLCLIAFFSTSVFAQTDLDAYCDSIIQSNIGKQFPSSTFTTLEGNVITSKECVGKVTIVNFWFETCSPCIAEFDALNALFNRFRNNPKFQFISLCRDTPEETKESVKKYRLPYPVCSLPHDECYRLNCRLAFPTTIIIDQTGKITFIKTGGSINKIIVSQEMKKIEEKIANLLSEK